VPLLVPADSPASLSSAALGGVPPSLNNLQLSTSSSAAAVCDPVSQRALLERLLVRLDEVSDWLSFPHFFCATPQLPAVPPVSDALLACLPLIDPWMSFVIVQVHQFATLSSPSRPSRNGSLSRNTKSLWEEAVKQRKHITDVLREHFELRAKLKAASPSNRDEGELLDSRAALRSALLVEYRLRFELDAAYPDHKG
jgi:hypothetical protein